MGVFENVNLEEQYEWQTYHGMKFPNVTQC